MEYNATMEYNASQSGFMGIIMTVLTALGSILSFLVAHIAIVTVPFTIAAAIFASRYYIAATAYYKSKKRLDDDRHDSNNNGSH